MDFYKKYYGSGKYAGIAWCPDCLTYGGPFMDRGDKQCGNCNQQNLRYYIQDTALKDLISQERRKFIQEAAKDLFVFYMKQDQVGEATCMRLAYNVSSQFWDFLEKRFLEESEEEKSTPLDDTEYLGKLAKGEE